MTFKQRYGDEIRDLYFRGMGCNEITKHIMEGMYKLEKELGISQATLIEYMVVSALQDPNFTSVDRIVDVDLLEQVAEQIEKESFDRKDKMM